MRGIFKKKFPIHKEVLCPQKEQFLPVGSAPVDEQGI
jgi:hypothetical protein